MISIIAIWFAAVILLCTQGKHMLHVLIEEFEFAQINDLSATLVSEEPNQMNCLTVIPDLNQHRDAFISLTL